MEIKLKTKFILSFSFLLIIALIFNLLGTDFQPNVLARTVNLQQTPDYQALLEQFEETETSVDGAMFYFTGYQTIDASAFAEIDNVSETVLNEMSQTKVKYSFSFNAETNIVTIFAQMQNEYGTIETDTLSGQAFYNLNNQIDALFEIEGEYILLSEMQDANMIENCGWFSKLIKKVVKAVAEPILVVAAVAAVVIVATAVSVTAGVIVAAVAVAAVIVVETSQQIIAKNNYEYNKTLLQPTGFITDQRNYEAWKFVTARMNSVGCEIVAAYNAMKLINKSQTLPDVIYDFEKMNIDYDIGYGHLGSNPQQMHRYFDKYELNYKTYNTLAQLSEAVANKNNVTIVMSAWNYESVLDMLHTYTMQKVNGVFVSYNYNYHTSSVNYYSLNDFCSNSSNFIVAYVFE